MSSAKEEKRVPYSMADLGASLSGLSVADRAGLVNALKGKLDSLAGRSSDYINSLSPKVKRRVIALQEIQKQHDDFEAKFLEERAALEAKYQKLYEPLYSKRHDLVNGITDVEPANEDVPADASVQENHIEDKVQGVPEFWLNAMKSNEILAMQITERDEDALKYLTDIKSSNLENEKGFKIDFFFSENPFFKNTILTKTYHMIDEDEPILERATGTEIEWYPGKNLTKKVLKKKPKKGAKNNKLITKTEDCDSFFNFFSPPKIPDDDDDIDQETAEELQDLMEQDYDIGSTIKSKIIPHAVSWFTGEALQGDEFEDDEDGEGDDDEEEEDEDDEDEEDDNDEEDDEDEDDAVKNTKGPLTKPQTVQRNTSSLPGGEQPPECKQQ